MDGGSATPDTDATVPQSTDTTVALLDAAPSPASSDGGAGEAGAPPADTLGPLDQAGDSTVADVVGAPVQPDGSPPAETAPPDLGVPRDALVLFEEAHECWPTLTGSWSLFAADLAAQGHTIRTHGSGELTAVVLQGVDVLVVGTSWGAFAPAELETIRNFVSGGGALFLTGLPWSWVDPVKLRTLENYPMNQIAQMFGIRFLDGFICDPTNFNKEDKCQPVFKVSSSHPIAAGIGTISGGCVPVPVQATGPSVEVVLGGDADAYSSKGYFTPGQRPPLILATQHGTGRVVAMGTEGYFGDMDDDKNGVANIDEGDNRQLGRNIIQFLAGYR
jgi:hypothetical protein